AIQLNGGQFVAFTTPFVNAGTVTVNAGQLDLAGDGIDTGDYTVGASNLLVISLATRQVLAAGSITGGGQLVVRDGATVDIDSVMSLPNLAVTGPMPAQLNYTNAGNLSLSNLAILDGSTLTTAAPIQVPTGVATLDAGTLRGTAAVSLFAGAPAMVFLPAASGSLFTFDDIAFILSGTANWQGGGLHLDNNADFQVLASGTLNIDSVTMMPQILGCSVCGVAPTLFNQGTITKTALSTGDNASINAPIQFVNQGSLQVNGGILSVASFSQDGGAAPSTTVNTPAQLDFGAMTGQFDVGTLSGNGQIVGDVNANGASVQPGTVTPGMLSITGNYTQSASSTLDVDLGGTAVGQFDQLQIGGSATVDGTVNVSQFGGFTPTPADVFPDIVTAVSLATSATVGTNDFPGFDLQLNGNVLEFANVGGPLMLEVTSTADPGDGVCDLAGTGDGCTLREAIDAANGNVGPDLITFNIVGAGVQTIAPLTPLPAITDETFIDGLSQPGAVGNSNAADVGGFNGTLLIELSGQNTTGDGLVVDAGSNEVIILGLVINRWSGAGVRVNSTFAADRSASRPSAFAGVRAPLGVTATASIVGNYIGTSADGLSVPGPQTNGVVVAGPAINGTVFIGDGAADGRNLISGNADHGVVISADDVRLLGNLVGTDATGLAPLGNGRRGVHLVGDNVVGVRIGGGMPASDRNIIGGNTEDGIGLQCAPAGVDVCFDGSVIIGNYIGVGVDGNTPVPNANGVNFVEMTFGLVQVGTLSGGEGNKIEFNAGAGVLAAPFAVMGTEAAEGRATISGNVFMSNGGPAIDLGADGRTGNDVGDSDAGFNNGQNFPAITNILFDTPGTNQTTLEYSVDSLITEALYPLQVEFYRANGDEGFELLGTDFYLQAEAGMTKQFVLPGTPIFAPEDVVIATATDANGKTSEFTFFDVAVAITNDSPDPSILGDPYLVEVTVTKVNGPFIPVGQVVVADGEPLPQTCGFALVVADGGVGSCMLSSPAMTGTLNLMAAFDGIDTPFGGNIPEMDPDGEPHMVGNPTSLLITDAVDPTPVGEPFTLDVTVSAAVGTPTGTVDVTSTGGESCSIPLVAGAGSCQLTPLTIGLRSLTAIYTPDPGFDGSTASEAHDVVVAASTATIVSDLPDPSSPGATVSVAVTVTPTNAGNVLIPSGGVMVGANTGEGCVIPSLDAAGNGSCNLVFATVGMRNLTATYSGDGLFNGSLSAAEPHDVQPLPPEDTTTTILSATPTPSLVGQPYQVQVQVTGNLGGTPCGDVLLTQLPDGSTCNATLAAGASPGTAVGGCQLTAPNAITKAITGVYTPGVCNFNGSQAPLFTHAVLRASTTTTITSQSPNPSNAGQSVTVGFAVAVLAPGAGTPTGTVRVTDGIDLCQADLPANSCQLSFKTAGNRTLTVSYSGDADYNGSNTTGTQQVVAAGSSTDLSIRKVNDRCTLPGGTRVNYVIEVRNLGPSNATGARVVDTIPAPLSNPTWTCTATSGSSCVASGTGNIDQLVNLQVDGVATFNLLVDVPATPETEVTNTATVTVPSGMTDPVPGNNSSSDTDPIGVFCDGVEDALSD
ncbi:MAG: Ig-like domain repeat protein, partial [Xanthomonadales bacterium]|nr:Ig-like domain repeat protein [Xanthomonadales bacterium]